jgi:hypothetical protein
MKYAYRETQKNTLVVNDEQATIVRTIFNWYINGLNNVKKIHQ